MSFRDWPVLRRLHPNFLASVRVAFVFGCKGSEALMITGDNKVYAVGKNESNWLGHTSSEVTRPYLMSVLSDENVDGFTCGGSRYGIFVIARLQNGKIYQWGSLPLDPYPDEESIPKLVPFGVEVKVEAVACGASHCMIVSDDGRVFTWGENSSGQLGLDGLYYDYVYPNGGTRSPRQVGGAIKGKFVTNISCGASFSIVILEGGKVFSWGSNDNGQLGINNKDPTSKLPVAVLLPDNVVIEKIACGYSHVLALSKEHKLYVWGDNSYSQLGIPPPQSWSSYEMPMEYGGNLRFVDIAASNMCELSVAQSESTEIYMWGKMYSDEIITQPTDSPCESIYQVITEPTDSQCESIHQVFAFCAYPRMMHKPIRRLLKAKRRSTKILETLESEFGNPENSDLTIEVDNREICVHRAILKMRSTYFKSMLSPPWSEENKRVIRIPDQSFAALEAYLKYLYTDKLDVNLELAVELLPLGDKYVDETFKLLCEEIIKRDVTADTVADLISLTRKMDTCKELNEFCLNYALRRAEKVVDSEGFKKWDPDTMTAFTVELAKMKKI